VQRLRDMWGINASFSLPLLPELARAADAGVPSFVSQPEGEAAGVYRQLAAALEGELERLDAAPRPEILEAEHVFMSPNQRPRGRAFRCTRPYSAVFTVFFSVVFTRCSFPAQYRIRALMLVYSARRPEILYLPVERRIVIALADGTQQSITPLELRRLCRSPANRPDALPADVEPLDFVPTGNYAVSVRWSDGHQSLLPYASFVRGV